LDKCVVVGCRPPPTESRPLPRATNMLPQWELKPHTSALGICKRHRRDLAEASNNSATATHTGCSGDLGGAGASPSTLLTNAHSRVMKPLARVTTEYAQSTGGRLYQRVSATISRHGNALLRKVHFRCCCFMCAICALSDAFH
jgi:hypothetical protein